ncbi:MAG: hypothetical protein ACLPTZ_07450 [Beijerinckiaceae bacterium]|jgi:hypothetical protein
MNNTSTECDAKSIISRWTAEDGKKALAHHKAVMGPGWDLTGETPTGFQFTRRPLTLVERAKVWLQCQWQRLPHLVWEDDEVDVTVALPLRTPREINLVVEIERRLGALGIDFDRDDLSGRSDWWWDHLEGPISVRFKSRARRPELRTKWPHKPGWVKEAERKEKSKR